LMDNILQYHLLIIYKKTLASHVSIKLLLDIINTLYLFYHTTDDSKVIFFFFTNTYVNIKIMINTEQLYC
jgi:hypothetical protein